MMHFSTLLRALLLAGFCLATAAEPKGYSDTKSVVKGKGGGGPHSFASSFATTTATPTPVGIDYHGGAIMNAPITVHFIWYGPAASGFTDTQKEIFRTLTSSFSATSNSANTAQLWWAINQMYYDASGKYVSGSVTAGSNVNDFQSQGASLAITTSKNAVLDVVSNAINTGSLPLDGNAVYVVVAHKSVTTTGYPRCSSKCYFGYGTNYCSWHGYDTISGTGVKYIFVGTGSSQCLPPTNTNSSPNNDPDMDAAVNVYGHELAEVVTNPENVRGRYAWYSNANGDENADKCNFNFGTTTASTTGGGQYNVVANNGKQYLIQQNWDFINGACAIASTQSFAGAGGGDPHFAATYTNTSTESGEPEQQVLDYDFQGLPDHTFCITSDLHLAINARFVGGDPDERGVTGTWMDAVGVLFASGASNAAAHNALVVSINQSQDFLEGDCYEMEYNGKAIGLKPDNFTDVRWTSPDGLLTLIRPAGHVGLPTWGNMTVMIEGSLHLEITTESETRIAREPLGKFLNLEMKGLVATRHVHGVLGQMFAPGAPERRVEMAVAEEENKREYVDGIVEDYVTPSLTDPGCYYSEFRNHIIERPGTIGSKRSLLSQKESLEIATVASLTLRHSPTGDSKTRHLYWR